MMKKEYVTPELETILFETSDIIVTSETGGDGTDEPITGPYIDF